MKVRLLNGNRSERFENYSECKLLFFLSYFMLGPTYGGGTVQGYLRSNGINVPLKRVNNILRKVDPESFQRRTNDTLDKTNR